MNHNEKSAAPCIVGIGASAGGFEAATALLSAVPADANLTFVLVQHNDPKHKSLAAELLARHTRLAVREAVDGSPLTPNTVYTLPADQEAGLLDGGLHLKPLPEASGIRLPIDRFFCSLGATFGRRAVGVILSGTGADGSVGIKAIVANGGIALVQTPATAPFDGMPSSAIATGVVSQVLPVADIAAALVTYARHLPDATGAADEEAISGDDMRRLLDTLRRQRPQNFAGYKSSTLIRRVERRMGLRGVASAAQYAQRLTEDEAEFDALAADMLIGVTDFFRDREAWALLTRVCLEPLVAARGNSDVIRAWVPGTSTGEEAYTLAMLLLEALDRAGKRCTIQVFATDANTHALAVARAGRYPVGIAAQVSAERLKSHFTISGDLRQYQVSAELRSCVVFGPQNLFGDPPFSRVDIVSCRNVLIYLDPDAQRRVISMFHFALRPGGCLMLGTAEHLGEQRDLFECLSKPWQIYRRVGGGLGAAAGFAPSGVRRPVLTSTAVNAGPLRRTALLQAVAQKLVLDHFAPAAVLVDTQHQALYFCGRIDRYLSRFKGAPTNDVLAMAGALRSRLRDALGSAARTQHRVAFRTVRAVEDGKRVTVEITVLPVASTAEHDSLYLVVFDEGARGRSAKPAGGGDAAGVEHLEEDLRTTRVDLQHAIEELESANRELSLSQEDQSTANEELQSVNEELESSKEELQSLNEELQTVNQQLQSKVTELETAHNDLVNLLKSSDIATLCLDPSMCIRWQSPAMQRLVNIRPGDIGRPIGDFASELLGPPLIELAGRVITSLTPIEEEIQTAQGGWFLRRVLPYRVDGREVRGVIVTLTDITATKHATAKALDERLALLGSLEQRVKTRTEQLRSMAFALSVAEERERRSVAADLHDDLGQTLALIRVKLEMLLRHSAGSALEAGAREITALIEAADERLRSLVSQLSPPVLHELGLAAALAWLGDEMQRVYGLKVHLEDAGCPQVLDPVVRTIVFRAVRELLINVVRHAKVGESHVACREADGNVEITVSDGGGGFDVPERLATAAASGHFGLAMVRERLEFVGGALEIRSVPDGGTEATVRVPTRLTTT